MMWDGNGNWGSGAGLMTIMFMIVFVVAVIVTIVFLVRYLGQSSGGTSAPGAVPSPWTSAPEPPRDILKRRYAAGEIERDEYLQKLGDV